MDASHEEGKEEQVPVPEEISDSESESSHSDSYESDDSMTLDETDQPISDYQQTMISSFTEIAAGQSTETAIKFLKTTRWNFEEAINLFLVQDSRRSSFLFEGSFDEAKSTSSQRNLWLLVNLQSKKDSVSSHAVNQDLWSNKNAIESRVIVWQVYDDTSQGQKISTFYKVEDSAPPVVILIDPITGMKMRSWSSEFDAQSFVEELMECTVLGPREYLASLTRKKHNMLCNESNQSSDHIVTPSSGSKFEESETCSSSNLIDHIMAETKTLPTHEEEEEETCLEFPVLAEEPKGDCDRSFVCSLCIRFPDGRRKQRRFLKSEPIQLLWSFCYSQMVESEKKVFKLVQAIPGASKILDYGNNTTFEQSGLDNSMVSVAWE